MTKNSVKEASAVLLHLDGVAHPRAEELEVQAVLVGAPVTIVARGKTEQNNE